MKHISKSLKDTDDIAKDILKHISINGQRAKVVGLYGDLGAGKTALTQALARELGIKEKVVSPTFVIMKSYQLSGSSFQKLIHIDAYRLEKGEELAKLGWAEIISDPENPGLL